MRVGVGVISLAFALAGCSETAANSVKATFDVKGQLIGAPDTVDSDGSSVFPDVVYRPNDQVVVRGADNRILAAAPITPTGKDHYAGRPGFCEMRFLLRGIPTGEAAYQVSIGSDNVVVPENVLHCSTTFGITLRTSLDQMLGKPPYLGPAECFKTDIE